VTGDPTFAEEAVQEVFLAVWRQPERFQAGRGGFGTWLLAAVHHKAVDAVRREEAVRRRALALQAVQALDASDPPASRPEDAVEERMRGERVRRALWALPEPQREALTLAYYGGYTQRVFARAGGGRGGGPADTGVVSVDPRQRRGSSPGRRPRRQWVGETR
jgi:RNA polymerase sigma-70 factor (ECF subfamily)